MIITSFSADYFERKEDPGVAKHNGQYMGKFIQILPNSASYTVSTFVYYYYYYYYYYYLFYFIF